MKLQFKEFKNNSYIKIFLLGFFTAFALFLPYIILDKGFFLYSGDFNSQQIPFYLYGNNMVSQGFTNWSWATDLGSSFVNSYAFYFLGSPFFWLSSLFPHTLSPYLMPLWLCLKLAFAALGAFCFIRRYAKNDNYAFVGAMLYAFSGFSIYNIFFNHFLESVAFFPFLLWSLDEFVYKKRKGVFMLFVALNLFNNYFFFIGQVVFLLIYFLCKYFTKEYIISIKQFFLLAFESVVGCLMGISLFIPSLINLLQNPRVQNIPKGFGLWLYSNVQQYFAIALSGFFPPESPYDPNLFTQGAIKWTSLSGFLVLGGLFGYFVYLKYKKRSSFTIIFSISLICAFVPILNSAFYAFNQSYYARWYYMPLLILAAMNTDCFSMKKQQIFHGLLTVTVMTCLFLVFALTPHTVEDKFTLGLQENLPIFWLYFLIAILSIYLLFLIVINKNNEKKYLQHLLMGAIALILIFSHAHMAIVKLPHYNPSGSYKSQNYDIISSFDLKDNENNFRLDAFECYNNLGLFLDLPILQSFNSVVTPSIMEFYPSVGVKRDVSSKPDYSNIALRSLLSVKYMIMPQHEVAKFEDEGYMSSYEDYLDIPPYKILKNKYYIPMGFVYENYLTPEELEDISPSLRAKYLLRAVVVSQDTVIKNNLPVTPLPTESLTDTSFATFEEDVQARKSTAAKKFVRTKDGFICNIDLDKEGLVFFQVPYDKGFKGYINGAECEIIKVSYGLSAVKAPRGDNEIIFKYRAVGLNAGIILSIIGFIIYFSYLIIIYKQKRIG